MEWLRFALGLALFLAPGASWAWAFGRGLEPWKKAALTPVLAFTLAPAGLMLLNLLLNVPINLATGSAVAVILTAIGLAAGVGGKDRARPAGHPGSQGAPPEA